MTKKESVRQTQQQNTLMSLGFTETQTNELRRISMTLHNWYERECGTDFGCIERDEREYEHGYGYGPRLYIGSGNISDKQLRQRYDNSMRSNISGQCNREHRREPPSLLHHARRVLI